MFPILYLFIITFVGVMANRPASECYSVTNMYGAEFTRDQNAQASGPPGLPGKKGPGGQRGDRGLPGLIGTKGSTGTEGVRGPPGPFQNGIPGKKGDIGEGSPGPQGIRGPVGPKGVRGNRGAKGGIGPPGLSQVGKPGEKGEPGEGIIGAKGNVGASGPQGSPGVVKVGSQGLTGAHGVPGEKGIPGVAGPQGPQGPNGVGKKGEKGEMSAEIEAKLDELTAKYERLQARQPPRSCAELPDSVTKSGYYLISPALSPFSVYCNFTQEGAYTIFEHDSEEEISVTKCRDEKCYSRDITYTNSIKHIREVIAHSRKCRQYLKYRCQASAINFNGKPFASWLSYNGEERHNMGGSSVAHTCKCGITGTCLRPTDKCNCDQNSDDVMTSDEGYLEDKDDLPVTNLKFGDTDHPKESGWHTLGKLECVGVALYGNK